MYGESVANEGKEADKKEGVADELKNIEAYLAHQQMLEQTALSGLGESRKEVLMVKILYPFTALIGDLYRFPFQTFIVWKPLPVSIDIPAHAFVI